MNLDSNTNITKTKFLLGNEAVALGAIHAGVSSAYAYPGTPSTEAMEYLIDYSKNHKSLFATWCTNEKSAYEEAVGASLVGKRSLVVMKHVGLNVAADAFMCSALVSIHGGLVVCVADDPGMNSSQSEQDTRFYVDFAKIFCFEPANQQEAYEMTFMAFMVSEKYHVPVLIRLTTRTAHTRGIITCYNEHNEQISSRPCLPKNKEDWITMPAYSRKMYAYLVEQQPQFYKYSNNSQYNTLHLNDNFCEYGVITTGIGKNYFNECINILPERPSHLHIGVYPIPFEKIYILSQHVKKILIVEEGQPFVEKKLKELLPSSITIQGKENGGLPFCGELTPENVKKLLGLVPCNTPPGTIDVNQLPKRTPSFCVGCSHIDTYIVLQEIKNSFPQMLITSDIGCYGMGALPPFSILDSMLCMGASIGMAKGAAEAGFHPVIATIGDSTFLHSGIPPLIDAVNNKSNITVIIMDNSAVAMTGGQDSAMPSFQIDQLILGIGVSPERMHVITPLKKFFKKNVALIKDEIDHVAPSVIIARRPCVKKQRTK